MAYIVDYALTFGSAGGVTNTAMNMPQHQTGDLLVALVTMNAGAASAGAASSPAQANWVVASDATNTANTFTWLRAIATASNNVLALTTADDYCCTVISIRDHGGTTATNAVNASNITGVTGATTTPINAAITPTVTDTLVLYMMSVAGAATMVHHEPGIHHVISYDNGGGNDAAYVHQSVGWYVQRQANVAVPTPSWLSNVSGVYARATIAITNATGGRIPAYIGDSPSPASTILGGYISTNVTGALFNYTGAFTMTGNMTNGKTTSFVANSTTAANITDLGINPFSSAATKAPATQAATALTGFELTFRNAANNANLARDFSTGGLIVGSVIGGTPKMGAFGIGSVAEGGCVVRVGSGASAWRAYQVAAKDAVPNTVTRSVFSIEPGFATSQYGVAGTWATNSTLYIQFLSNQPSFASTVCWSEIYYAGVHTVCGGTTASPVDSDGLADVGKSYRLPVIQKFGGAGLISYVPIRIGGEDTVIFEIDAGALQFPRRYSATTKELAYHGSDGKLGISYAGVSGDVIRHTNSVITSPTRYYWEINSAATSAATWDFAGLSVVNANLTFRPVMTFSEMSFTTSTVVATNASSFSDCAFNSCLEVTAASGTFTGCEFSESAGTNGALSITGATQTALQTELNKITNCSFVTNITPLGALRIVYTGTAGAITLSMSSNTFSGNTKDIRWEAPAGSNLTLNLTGSANPSTFSATNSNTVSFNNPKTFTITNIVDQSEVRIYRTSDDVELGGVELVGSTPSGVNNVTVSADPDNAGRFRVVYAYNYGTDTPIFVMTVNNSYQVLRSTATLKNTDGSLQVVQAFDRQYNNPV